MPLKSVLRSPSEGVALGLGEAVAVYLIYNSQLPSGADVRMGPANEKNLEAARKGAAWKSAALLGVVFLLTRDLHSFIIGGVALGGIDYLAKHNNAVNQGGKWTQQDDGTNIAPSNVFNLPNYQTSEAM